MLIYTIRMDMKGLNIMEKKNVTFKDIAEYTGFSKTTISRYFNNPDSITLENQEKIADALEALDYKENKVARILANGQTEYVGVIIPNLYFHYHAAMLNCILSTYEQYGYKFLVFVGNEHKATERKYISELLAYKIEGMIILSYTIPSEELASYNVPIVTIEREDKYVCSVNTDNYAGAKQATELLIDNGCDVLIHLNSDMTDEIPAYGRVKAFRDICAERRIKNELIIVDLGAEHNTAKEKITRIIDELDAKYPNQKKGIFMPNDTYANIMLNVLIRKHGTLPDDYRIVGFDNSPISAEAVIPISTVDQQIDTMAREAMELLVTQMNERKKRRPEPLEVPVHRIVTPVLVKRETTD